MSLLALGRSFRFAAADRGLVTRAGGADAVLREDDPRGPDAGLSPSLADFGDAEVAKAEAVIESRPSAAGPYAISPVQAEAIPPVEAIDIPPVHAPDIKV